MFPLQPIIDAIPCRGSYTLPDGEYNDCDTVFIDKPIQLIGSRNAIVHSEIQISSCNVHFSGFTLNMNKVGAPQHNGVGARYPQNGMIVVLSGAILWADDLEVNLAPCLTGDALRKNAFHVVGSLLQLRAVTQFSRIDWRNSPWQVIEMDYNSLLNIFDLTNGQGMNIASGTQDSGGPVGWGAATISVMASRLIMSGSNIFNCATTDPAKYAVNAGRDSYIQLGAGANYTTIQQYGNSQGIVLDPTSRQWIDPTPGRTLIT